jgi:AraC-like DNA-binding protein
MAANDSLLSHAHADIFQVLRVSAAIYSAEPGWLITDSPQWRALHTEPDVIPFEVQHGIEAERYSYNARCMAQARRQRKAVLGVYLGLSDLFVPILRGKRVLGILASGPFGTARPTSAEVLERWRRLTGHQGHPADPEFAHYLSMTLSTLVLEAPQVSAFSRFLTCFARLMAGEGDPVALLAEADALRGTLENARLVERMWTAARSMVHEWTHRSWSSPHVAGDLKRLGLATAPDQLVVGLMVSLQRDADPVDDLMRRDAFQRACVALAQSEGAMLSGQVGDHGVTFLSGARESAAKSRKKLLGLADKAATLAKNRFAIRLHLGVSPLPGSAPLSTHYESALGAAEEALSQRARIVHAAPGPRRPNPALGELRRQLRELGEHRPDLLPARFDRFIEAVTMRSGYRLELARAHLEAGLERIEEALVGGGALEASSFDDACAELERAAREARTVTDLLAAYRRMVTDLSEAVHHPAQAHQDRRVRRAITHVERHYSEKLTLAAVARVAGFAPNYFSRLFKQRERVTLELYIRGLRIARAKQLLASTDLEVKRVAQLSGFATQHYFARVFRRAVGTTALAFRRRAP